MFQVSDQLQMYMWHGVLLSACNQMAALPLWLLSKPGKELSDITKFILALGLGRVVQLPDL